MGSWLMAAPIRLVAVDWMPLMTAEGSSIAWKLSTRPVPKVKEPHGVEMLKSWNTVGAGTYCG